jgi:TRAP transporter 4TM/12TM fusion protein
VTARAHAGRALAVSLSVLGLYWVAATVDAHVYRAAFLLLALAATFVLFPSARAGLDWSLLALTAAALGWPILDRDAFVRRSATPSAVDLALGTLAILLVLEATRRTAGWALTITAALFLAYAYLGPLLDLVGLEAIGHRGYDADRLVGALYMTLDGIFGVPLDVAATYIVLFTLYGAVLERSGAGRFFIDWSLAAMGRNPSPAAPGRAVTLAGFLLGTVSGSGVATTVTLGSLGWPILRRAGYTAETGGAICAAAGIGALLSPPTLGAAAFLLAEFVGISYFEVLVAATVPMLLYYLSALVMIEADARRLGAHAVALETPPLASLTRRYGHHFLSLVAVAVLMAAGMSAFRAVAWAILLAVALSFVRPEAALRPRLLLAALDDGGRGVLSVTATTAAAGIVVGVVTLTGLGLEVAGLVVALAGGSVALTAVFAAAAVWLLGLAVPVTASYILSAVMIAPALVRVGVDPVAAHMFIFYYAVLSEVSPPTALAPYAAAAVTGGDAVRTTLATWRYTLPAFVVPFAFALAPRGLGLLLRAPALETVTTVASAAAGVFALAVAAGGWLRGPATGAERAAAAFAGLLLVYPSAASDTLGAGLLAGLAGWRLRRR